VTGSRSVVTGALGGWLLSLVVLAFPVVAAEPAVVMFFGDSLTAGYGVGKENGFPAQVQDHADSVGCAVRVVNAGLAGETSAGGLRRVDWMLQQPVHVFVLELGGNDGLRGVPLAETQRNLQGIIDRVRAKAPQAQVVLVGVRLPPNLGPDYTEAFQALFVRLATANAVPLIPQLLVGVAGNRKLMRNDGIHPNVAGHRLVAQTVWRQLAPLLCDLSPDSASSTQDLEGRHTGDTPAAE
jgi:acyl-CoA thioesterase I